jgi:hypothetical protein
MDAATTWQTLLHVSVAVKVVPRVVNPTQVSNCIIQLVGFLHLPSMAGYNQAWLAVSFEANQSLAA